MPVMAATGNRHTLPTPIIAETAPNLPPLANFPLYNPPASLDRRASGWRASSLRTEGPKVLGPPPWMGGIWPTGDMLNAKGTGPQTA